MQNNQSVNEKKNIIVGLLAHVDAGKTTLAEGILYTAGELRSLGRVDHQNCFLDTDSIERKRGITIFSKEAHAVWKETALTLLDTPGHTDFSTEMERTLSVLDIAILIIGGNDGVSGHTETLWKLLKRNRIPTIVFVNKMDQPQSEKESIYSTLQSKLKGNFIDFSDLVSQLEEFYENLSMCSEELLEEYLATNAISKDSITAAFMERDCIPVFFGSALKLNGIEPVLDFINTYVPFIVYPDEFGARIFKITRDNDGKRLTHMKITGGTLFAKQVITNEGNVPPGDEIWQEKADQLRIYSGTKFLPAKEAKAGSIIAVTGLTKTYAGEGVGIDPGGEDGLLEPVLEYCIGLPDGIDALEALPKFKQLEEEDPKLHILYREEDKTIRIKVMGQIQLQILKDKIKERFQMEIRFENGKIVYKETIQAPSYGIGHFEPLRHYAEVHLLIEPGERGSGIQFASVCSEDVLSKNWQRLIETHVEETIHPGVLTRSQATDLKVILVTGKAHNKHTEGGDFRQATYRAIRNALRKADNILLEPIYRFTLELPIECVGRAMTDLEARCARMDAPVSDGDYSTLTGTVPVVTIQDYQLVLQAYTAGRGTLSLIPDGFMPCHNTEEVINEIGYDCDNDFSRPTGSVFCAHGAGYQVPWDEVEALAHVECPLKVNPGNNSDDLIKYSLPISAIDGKTKEQISGGNAGSDFISLEEIDAILNSTFRKKEGKRQAEKKDYKKLYYAKTPASEVGGSEAGNKDGIKYAERKNLASNGSASSKKKMISEKDLKRILFVDGYNIIFAWPKLNELAKTNIDSARDALMDICCDYQGFSGEELILVFDAYRIKGNQGSEQQYHNIRVIYTKESETADAYIERESKRMARGCRVTVATSDNLEQKVVWGNGALRMSAMEFLENYEKNRVIMKEQMKQEAISLSNNPFSKIQLPE